MLKKEVDTTNTAKQEGRNLSALILPVLFGTGIALILLLLLTLLVAGLILGGIAPAEQAGMALSLCSGICAFVGGRFSVQKGSGQPMLAGAATAVLLCLVMILICLGSGGSISFHAQFAGTLLMLLAGGCLSGLLGTKKKKKRKKR